MSGRQTKRDKLHLEGTTDLDEQLLQMTLWMNGGNVQDEETGSQIKVEGDQAYARQGMQPWQETNNFSGLFAPQNDFMAYLVAAINVQNEGVETRAGITFTRYSFDIDGPAYARHMRDQMESELQRRGELPAGVKLGVSELYSGMSGSGELWIGEDGLPLRQIMQLVFAPQEDSQTSAEVTVNFKDFNPVVTVAAANNSPAAAVLDRMAPVIPGSATPDEIIASANEAAAISATFLIALLFLGIFALILLISIRSRPIMAGLQLLLIFSMLFSPLIQGVHAAGVFDRFQARARAQDEQSQDSNMSEDLKTVMDKGQPAAAKGTVDEILNDPGTDSDSDGYTDVEEKFLGTNAQAAAGTRRTSLLSPA